MAGPVCRVERFSVHTLQASSSEMKSFCARARRWQSIALCALILAGCVCSGGLAILCEIHAKDGLEEAVAATAAVAAERQMMMHLLPLCRVPYLVNSPLQPRDLFHVGVEEGGVIELDINLLPGPYKNNMPSRQPRFREGKTVSAYPLGQGSSIFSFQSPPLRATHSDVQADLPREDLLVKDSRDLSPSPASLESLQSSTPNFNSPETRLPNASVSSAGSPTAVLSSAARALFEEAKAEAKGAWSEQRGSLAEAGDSLSSRRLQAEGGRIASTSSNKASEARSGAKALWMETAADAAAGGFSRLVRRFAESFRLEDFRARPLLLSSLIGNSSRHSALPEAAVLPAVLSPLAWNATIFSDESSFASAANNCTGTEASSSLQPAVSRRLEDVGGDVFPLNNTYVLLLNHAQLYFLEASETWSQSFTARSGLVLNSYVPSLLRLPLTGPRLRAKVKAPRHDRYSLVLLNGDGLDLRLEGSVSFSGPTQKHLSLEQLYLPQTECFLMVLHFAAALAVLLLQRFKWKRQSRFLSLLFSGYYLLSAFVFGFDYAQSLHVQEVGRRPAALWLLSRLMRKFQDVTQLLVFLCVAIGYSIMRDRLSRLEIRFVAGVCVISVYLGVFEIILGGFQEARYVLHVACFVRVLIAIHTNITSLQNSLAGSSLSPSVSDLYYKLRAYKNFRRLFFLFLFKPVFSIFFKLSFLGPTFDQLMSWDEWIFVLAENLADFLVISGICYYFCPHRPLKVLQLASRELAETDAVATQTSLQ